MTKKKHPPVTGRTIPPATTGTETALTNIANLFTNLAQEVMGLKSSLTSPTTPPPTTPPPLDVVSKANATLDRLDTELKELEELLVYKTVKEDMRVLNNHVQELKKGGIIRGNPFLKKTIDLLYVLVTNLDKEFTTISQKVSQERAWLIRQKPHLSPDNAGQIANSSRQEVLKLLKDIEIRLPKMAASIQEDKPEYKLMLMSDDLRKLVGGKFQDIGTKAKDLYNKEKIAQ